MAAPADSPNSARPTTAGIVLCGGQSRRMERPKHLLPIGPETALQRVVRIVGSVVSPVVVVGAPEQEFPELPGEVLQVRDPVAHLGPLAGLVTGLEAVGERAAAVYLCGCDMPLLKPEWIEAMASALDGSYDIAAPQQGAFLQPLAAVYRSRLLPIARGLLDRQDLRLQSLLESCRTRKIPVEQLRQIDPDLDSLRNMNTPGEYAAILERFANQAAPG